MTEQSQRGRHGARPLVAIVGGGFTGAALAYHLTQGGSARAGVFEPREEIGRGLAYGQANPAFRINVPATRMSLFPSDRLHFSRWIAATGAVDDDPDALASDGRLYPRRRVFGDYVAAQLAPRLTAGAVIHRRAKVTRIGRDGAGWRLTDETGAHLHADAIVLAASHPPGALPPQLSSLEGHPRLSVDALGTDAYASLRRDARVLIVGSGLTAADALAALDRAGHRGPALLIARRGQRPRPQARFECEPFGDFTTAPATTALTLVRRVRAVVWAAARKGVVWQAVLDTVRSQGGAIWSSLPVAERRRLVRHARPYWDAHRFRAAPQVFDLIERRVAEGAASFMKASLREVVDHGEEFEVVLAVGSPAGALRRRFDHIIVATGPSHKDILAQSWAASLHQADLLTLDPFRLGLNVNRRSEALNAKGDVVHGLFVGGPLARGAFGELMGLPEVSEHAALTAASVLRYFRAEEARGAA